MSPPASCSFSVSQKQKAVSRSNGDVQWHIQNVTCESLTVVGTQRKESFLIFLFDGSFSTSPAHAACAPPPMNYYSSRIIGGHTDDLFPHISLNEDRQKFGHSLSPHLATWTETGFRSTDSRHPTRTDLNVLIYFLSSSVWPQNKLKTRSIHMVIRIRRRNKKRSLSGTTIEEVN